MAKTTFVPTEKLFVTLEPFIDPTTGSYIESGDTVGADVVKPDLSTTTVSFTRNATSKVWTAEILVADYMQGRWEFRATSNDSSSPKPQYRVCWWGVGVEEQIPAIKAKTDNLPSDPADESLIIAAVDALAAVIGTPAQASVSADLAYMQVDVDFLRKMQANRMKIDPAAKQTTFYDDDGTTPLAVPHTSPARDAVFDTKDDAGAASGTKVYERVPA